MIDGAERTALDADGQTVRFAELREARAGNAERAVEHFNRVADYLFQEGFYPKAAALYKKSLKAKGDDEHTLLQLGAIAAKQGLLADDARFCAQCAAPVPAADGAAAGTTWR